MPRHAVHWTVVALVASQLLSGDQVQDTHPRVIATLRTLMANAETSEVKHGQQVQRSNSYRNKHRAVWVQ